MTDLLPTGPVGIWSTELRHAGRPEVREAVAELQELGYGTLWLPGLDGNGALDDVAVLLEAGPALNVTTGVLNIWSYPPAELARRFAAFEASYGARTTVGLGVGAPAGAAAHGQDYGRPLGSVGRYLDALDAAPVVLPPGRRLLGALGPRMVDLAVARSAGWHPFLVPPRYVAAERARVGPGPFIAPHQAVVLETDPDRARAAARAGIGVYLGFPTYRASMTRLGYGEADLVPGGSDRLIDDLVAWGDEEAVAARVQAHLAAGADHVALHVLGSGRPGDGMPRHEWRVLSALRSLSVGSPTR